MVQFRRVASGSDPAQHLEIPIVLPVEKAEAEARLFAFLQTLLARRPHAAAPLLLEAPALHALYTAPHPDLVAALRHCVDDFLVDLSPDAAHWGELVLPPDIWGVTLALHNALVPSPPPLPAEATIDPREADPALSFTTALLDTLAPARSLRENLVYHALLRHPIPRLSDSRAALLARLLHLSPLSAMYHLDAVTPPPLIPLAKEMLSGWQRRPATLNPWAGPKDWLGVVAPLLDPPLLVRYLRQRWLSLPATRAACRNLGLLLESLRRRGQHRAILLEFYEAYEYLHAAEGWPVLAEIETLLRAGIDLDPAHEASQEVAFRLNQWGREYFMLFEPLVGLIGAEGGIPADYQHLRDLPLRLRGLLAHIPEGPPRPFDPSRIQFESEEDTQ